jgi:hypothetical protein
MTEQEDKARVESPAPEAWRPEAGKTAWMMAGCCCIEVAITGVEEIDGFGHDNIKIEAKGFGERSVQEALLHPSAESALASIRVYDISGKEAEAPRLAPKPLEWDMETPERGEFIEAKSGDWAFYCWFNGNWSVELMGHQVFACHDEGTPDEAKAAIHQWRVDHLKSMMG